MLTFDEATHTYYWNGVQVPNITSVLKEWVECSPYKDAPDSRFFVNTGEPGRELASCVRGDQFDLGRQKGSGIHAIDEILMQGGDINLGKLDKELHDAYFSLKLFRDEFEPRPFEHEGMPVVEMRMYSKKYGYACTPDFLGYVNAWPELTLWETKKPKDTPLVGLQTAGQEQAFREWTGYRGVIKRYKKRPPMKGRGRCEFLPLKDRRDWPRYKNKLTEHNIRMEG